MNMLAQFGENQKRMSHREVAELTGKEARHVKRDCEVMFVELGLDPEGYAQPWTHPQNSQTYIEYMLTRDLVETLITGYSIKLRHAVLQRWRELESQVSLPSYAIEDPIERAKKWIEEEKQKQLAIQERDHAIATKAEIGSRREATAMGRLSAKVKEVEKLKTQLDSSTGFATIKKVQSLTGGTYDTYALRRHSKAQGLEIQKAEDANYGSVNSYHKDAWLAVYNINLSSIGGEA